MNDHVNIDIELAEQFVKDLRRAAQVVRGTIGELGTARLAERWRDDQFAGFQARLARTKEKLNRFAHEADDISRHLDTLTAAARDIRRHGGT